MNLLLTVVGQTKAAAAARGTSLVGAMTWLEVLPKLLGSVACLIGIIIAVWMFAIQRKKEKLEITYWLKANNGEIIVPERRTNVIR